VLGGSELDLPISFSGPYKNSDLPTLIISEQADIIYFAVQCPETYSYTLSTALNSGLPIVAPKIGAFIERLSDYPSTRLIEWDVPPKTVNDLLLDIVAEKRYMVKKAESSFGSMTCDAYLEQYTSVIKSCVSTRIFNRLIFDEIFKIEHIYSELTDSIIDNLGRNRLIEIIKSLIEWPSDRTLTGAQVEVWRTDLLAKQKALTDRLADKEQALVDKEQALANLNQRIAERCQEIEQERWCSGMLQQQVADRERVIQEIYSSNSWWLTRPVRWLGRQYRRFR
jgi:hypothetical protein